jgi:hypothetical protein
MHYRLHYLHRSHRFWELVVALVIFLIHWEIFKNLQHRIISSELHDVDEMRMMKHI